MDLKTKEEDNCRKELKKSQESHEKLNLQTSFIVSHFIITQLVNGFGLFIICLTSFLGLIFLLFNAYLLSILAPLPFKAQWRHQNRSGWSEK